MAVVEDHKYQRITALTPTRWPQFYFKVDTEHFIRSECSPFGDNGIRRTFYYEICRGGCLHCVSLSILETYNLREEVLGPKFVFRIGKKSEMATIQRLQLVTLIAHEFGHFFSSVLWYFVQTYFLLPLKPFQKISVVQVKLTREYPRDLYMRRISAYCLQKFNTAHISRFLR